MYNMTRKVASQLFIIPYTAACKCLVSLHDAGILSRSHIQEGWQNQSLVDFQLVSSLIPFRSQIFAQSLLNATLAFAILAVTSSSTCTSLQNIGIKHGFQCSNIRWITRKVFEHKAAGRVFKHLPSDPANV